MAAHTPGPWEAWSHNRSRRPEHSHGISAEGRSQCDVADVIDFEGHPEESGANARLIAACPTMYEYISRRAEEGDDVAARIIAPIG